MVEEACVTVTLPSLTWLPESTKCDHGNPEEEELSLKWGTDGLMVPASGQ